MKNLLFVTGFILLTFNVFSANLQFKDTTFHFTFDYPETWVQTTERGENLRVVIVSPDEKYTLAAYGFFLESGHYDLEKFATFDTAMFQRLGEISETNYNMVVPFLGKTISEVLSYVLDGTDEILSVEKIYNPNKEGYYARSYITADEHYAYVLLAYSKTNDFSGIIPVFESFETTSTWLTKQENDFTWANTSGNLYGVVISLLVFAYFSGLVLSGRNFKKWSRRRKALNSFRTNLKDGAEPDRKWQYAYRSTTRKLIYAILLLLVLSAVGLFYLSGKWYIYVSIPFFFILGYFGYSLVIKEP